MKNLKFILPVLALGIVLGGAGVMATKNASAFLGNKDGAAKELSEKLGVEESKINEAMNQIQSDRQKERRVEMNKNLDKAVTDGAITAEQKQKLLDHMAEKQKQRQEDRANEKKWRDESGIDFSKLSGYGMGMGEKGVHRGGMKK